MGIFLSKAIFGLPEHINLRFYHQRPSKLNNIGKIDNFLVLPSTSQKPHFRNVEHFLRASFRKSVYDFPEKIDKRLINSLLCDKTERKVLNHGLNRL